MNFKSEIIHLFLDYLLIIVDEHFSGNDNNSGIYLIFLFIIFHISIKDGLWAAYNKMLKYKTIHIKVKK